LWLGAGGTELVQVQSVLDKQVAGFLQRLLAAVGIINARWVACSPRSCAFVYIIVRLGGLGCGCDSNM
jgi:hypothetical protein